MSGGGGAKPPKPINRLRGIAADGVEPAKPDRSGGYGVAGRVLAKPAIQHRSSIGDIPAATAILDHFLQDAELIRITGRSYKPIPNRVPRLTKPKTRAEIHPRNEKLLY